MQRFYSQGSLCSHSAAYIACHTPLLQFAAAEQVTAEQVMSTKCTKCQPMKQSCHAAILEQVEGKHSVESEATLAARQQ